ncbi:D-glycero-alpha-D-manno-heptose-1,7-bisphosphate 7-phosphatase [Desulfoplanes formicivorans]|uniref:D,D-heptose 1,7-bisphosphate phosphatase n=1 Tax=Desulfoplanes formicivorans TaxID=1592317 RepID=A0A194AJE9_9BACT|nr:HAD family hydrolase [Desulfoplanes formicivorans]GAU09365.1 haloacid dehalogenase [Desulfoplanes formicivorans]
MTTLPDNVHTILLDRDGTLIRECHYLKDPHKVRLIPGVAAPMRRLREQGVRFYLVTNQSGIGRGYFSMQDFQAVQKRLRELLRDQGITLAGEAFCPHTPQDACSCRKPATGMWKHLAARDHLDPRTTVMIGDKRADIAFGLNASLYTILVLTGHGRKEAQALEIPLPDQGVMELQTRSDQAPHAVATDLGEALSWIARRMQQR